MNKTITILGVTIFSLFFALNFAFTVYALDSITGVDTTGYRPLTTLPGAFEAGVPTNPVKVVAGVYGLAIGVGSVIAVIMIIYAGFQYMYEESINGKSEAKSRIVNAFLGLFVILGSYILLRTINPDLVNFDVTLQGSTTKKLANLAAATRRLDEANANATIALKNISQINTQLTDLQKQLASTTDPEKAKIITENIQSLTVAKANHQTIADQNLVVAKIDQNLFQLGPGGVSKASPGNTSQSIIVNIQASQDGVNKLFDKTLSDLSLLDQNNPNVQRSIAETKIRKESMNAEFNQQKMINAIYNPSTQTTSAPTNIYVPTLGQADRVAAEKRTAQELINQINSDSATYVQKLKSAGLTAEAIAFQERARERLATICAQKKICQN